MVANVANFKENKQWFAAGDWFSVEVKVWKSMDKFIWNVYAHIFEKHPIFEDNQAIYDLPFYGVSYDSESINQPLGGVRYDWQTVTKVKKVGCDYNHLGDNYLNRLDGSNGIPENIERDAKELFDFLENYQGGERV